MGLDQHPLAQIRTRHWIAGVCDCAVGRGGGGGPSLKTWPRWLPQVAQLTSVRIMPWLRSVTVSIAPGMGSLKLGQPVPLSNLTLPSNNGVPQPAQENVPGRFS